MKLDTFVAESLKAIYEAVKTAQEISGVPVAQASFRSDQPIPAGFVLLAQDGPSALVPVIEFDIAVTVNDEAEVSAGLGAALTVVGIGAKGKAVSAETSVSRIRFSIPVNLPSSSTTTSSDY